MDEFKFRPTLVGLEDRDVPSVTPADVMLAFARTQANTTTLMQLYSHMQHTVWGVYDAPTYKLLLPAIGQQARNDAAVLTEFQGVIESQMVASPALAAAFAPADNLVRQAAQRAFQDSLFADSLAVGVGVPLPAVYLPPQPPAPPPPPPPILSSPDQSPSGISTSLPSLDDPRTVTKPDGLKILDVVQGTGQAVQPGDTVTVHYTGWLTNGTQFDSSVTRGQPATFSLDQVIKGWQEGVPGMQPGGIRRLFVPTALGYGAQGSPPTIPPNSDLVFEIKLLSITPASTSATPTTTG